MGKQVTTGYITDIMEEPKFYKRKEISLSEYVAQKVSLLRNHFMIKSVTKESFYGCQNEIAVDNRARRLIMERI